MKLHWIKREIDTFGRHANAILAHFSFTLVAHFSFTLLAHFSFTLLAHFSFTLLAHFSLALFADFSFGRESQKDKDRIQQKINVCICENIKDIQKYFLPAMYS